MKRGISPLLSVVMIVGLTIITGIFVFTFGIDLINNLTGNNKEVQEGEDIEQQQITTRDFNTFQEIQTYNQKFITSNAIVKDNSINYLTKDYLGSVRAITNENGNKVYEQDYLPYGKELKENTNEQEHTYTNKEYDGEIGLYYYGARYYNPNTGRFTQVDPIDSITSPYESFRNNPNKYTDPDGREEKQVWKPIDPGYSQGYFPGLTSSQQDYVSPIKLLFTGHPIKSTRQYLHNLKSPEPYRFLDIVDIPTTTIEVIKGETNPVWLLAAAVPFIPGALSKATKIGIKIGLSGSNERVINGILDSLLIKNTKKVLKDPRVVKESSDIINKFERGNMNPGIGTTYLVKTKGVFYARTEHGTRVYFRREGDKIQVLAIGNKNKKTQDIISKRLRELHPKK